VELLCETVHGLVTTSQAVHNLGELNGLGQQLAANVSFRKSGSRVISGVTVRFCNAFAFEAGIDVFHFRSSSPTLYASGSTERLTRHTGPLLYRRCTDLDNVRLGSGSQLEFKAPGGLLIGTFQIRAVPPDGSMVLLVIYRHDRLSTAAEFTSHIFSSLEEPQIAIIDAYRGSDHSVVELRDASGTNHQFLRYGTAVSLDLGFYFCKLVGDVQQTSPNDIAFYLDASASQRFTVIRVGVDAYQGPSYPEDLIVYPVTKGLLYSHAPALAKRSHIFVLFTLLTIMWSSDS